MAAIAIFVSGANFSARTDEVSEDLSVGGAGAEKLQLLSIVLDVARSIGGDYLDGFGGEAGFKIFQELVALGSVHGL